MKSSFHSLIHFLPFLLSHLRLPSPELDALQFLCSQAHIPAGWRLETQLDSMLLLPASELDSFLDNN
jgi:hypothetical protein